MSYFFTCAPQAQLAMLGSCCWAGICKQAASKPSGTTAQEGKNGKQLSITESWSSSAWQPPQDIIQSNRPFLKAGSARACVSGPCPVKFLIPTRMEPP